MRGQAVSKFALHAHGTHSTERRCGNLSVVQQCKYLRSESVRTGVKKWLSDWRGNLWDQAESIRHYLSELAKQYKNMVLIRADLNYAEYAIDASDAMPRMEWVVSDGGVWMPVPSNAAIGHGRPETRARIDTAVAMGQGALR